MSSSQKEPQQGPKRTPSSDVGHYNPKRVRRTNDDAPTPISPSHPGSIFSSTSEIDQDIICQPCQKIKIFEALLEVIERRKKATRIRRRDEAPFQDSCPCCRMLHYCQVQRSIINVGGDGAYFYRVVKSDKVSASAEAMEVFRLSEPLTNIDPRRFSVRRPRKNHIPEGTNFTDFKTFNSTPLKEQLRVCRQNHEHCQVWHRQQVRGLKVIDCQTRKIVQAQIDCEYVALSYVWGSQSFGDLQTPPSTIADALAVTRMLGFDYLWVDRYCIDQHNSQDKHTQIQQMGLIYSQAQVTIVAAAGENPSHGLLGVSKDRPGPSPIRINGHELYPMHETSQAFLAASVWMTRAWTYQEFVLSKRRLVFTDQHAFLECQETLTEEWPASLWRNTFMPENQVRMGGNLDAILSFRSHMSDLDRLCENIRRYSKRSLTYPSDALNGILGVLSTFREASTPVYHLHGLPYIFDGAKAELKLMWWENDVPDLILSATALFRRRLNGPDGTQTQPQDFPSWSWTAWECRDPRFSYHEDYRSTLSEVSVELINGDDKPQRLEDYARCILRGEETVASRFIRIKGWILPVEIRPAILGGKLKWEVLHGGRSMFPRVAVKDLPSPAPDSLGSKSPAENVFALLCAWSYRFYYFLLLERESTCEYRRIGMFVQDTLESNGSAVERLKAKFPKATESEIRLG